MLQAGLKETKDIDEIHAKKVNEKEVAALQYLGGYVISNFYRKLESSKNYQSEECQEAVSLLSVWKSDAEKNGSTRLVNAFNLGGLYVINGKLRSISI